MSTATNTTLVHVFTSRSAAERAVDGLRNVGIPDDRIGLVGKDHGGQTVNHDGSGTNVADKRISEGAAIGAVTGAVGGAVVSFGLLTGVIPVIGPVLALGALGTVLLNTAGTAAAVGIAGALLGWGIAEDDAKYYEGQVAAGHYLVTVDVGEYEDEARKVMTMHGGFERLPEVEKA